VERVRERSFPDHLALVLATGLGAGYGPWIPGTFGSIVGLGAAWLLALGGPATTVAGLTAIVALGVWAAGRAEAILGKHDPGPVVVDEIAGQVLALAFVPLTGRAMLVGFLLFRILDIVKPFPARRLESLPGGSGIMADDLAAGLYANLLLQGAAYLFRGWMGTA
jgi:phosphatidylglycerophosphatase A